jgi:hypothetical protein
LERYIMMSVHDSSSSNAGVGGALRHNPAPYDGGNDDDGEGNGGSTNVPLCLWAIVGWPLLLFSFVWVLGIFPEWSLRNLDATRRGGTTTTTTRRRRITTTPRRAGWWGTTGLLHHLLLRRRRAPIPPPPPMPPPHLRMLLLPRGAVRVEGPHGIGPGIIESEPTATPPTAMTIGGPFVRRLRRHRRRAEWATFVHMLSLPVGQAIVTVAMKWIWGDGDDAKAAPAHDGGENGSSSDGNSTSSSSIDIASWAIRMAASLLVVVPYGCSLLRQKQFLVAAVGLPLVMGWYAHYLAETFSRLASFELWAEDRHFWEKEEEEGSRSSAPTDRLFGGGAAEFWILQHPLAGLAVAVEQTCWLLMLLFMVVSLDRLLSLQESIHAFLTSRRGRNQGSSHSNISSSSNNKSAIRRVYRITKQFDVSVTAVDEYQIDDPHPLTRQIADRVFEMFEEAGAEHSQLAVWLGTHACVCNFTPPTPETVGPTGRVPTALALECVCTATLPLVGVHLLSVYAASSASVGGDVGTEIIEDASRGSIVASMDAFFDLLALYDCDEHVFIEMGRGANFAGQFPVSRRGLQALAKDPNRNARSNRHRHRSLNLDRLALAEDQWGCLLRGCNGPGVKIHFFCERYGKRPDAIRALIQALAENECRAHVDLNDAHVLPAGVLVDFAAALERNCSLTELAISIGCRNERSGFSDPVAAQAAGDIVATTIFDGLARRNAPLDVLDLSAPVFSSLLWNRLWNDVVPAAGLNLKTLVLRTGAGLDPRTPPTECNVHEEERMIRAVSASTSLCTFDYKDWNIPSNNTEYLERIELAVRPFLRFNRFRRLALQMEHEPSGAVQKRWFATTLLRSVACNEASWCYFLLKRNAAGFHECIDVRRTVQLQRHRADVA